MLYVFQRNSTENHKGNAAQFALRRCMMFLNLGRGLRGQRSNGQTTAKGATAALSQKSILITYKEMFCFFSFARIEMYFFFFFFFFYYKVR
jgi:hypothetical protein